MKQLPDVKLRYNVPGALEDMKDRVKGDFLKHYKAKMHKSLVDAMIFRGYNELEEMQKHFQTRPHVLRYFSENENLNRALHGKRKTLEALRLELEENKKRKQLEQIRGEHVNSVFGVTMAGKVNAIPAIGASKLQQQQTPASAVTVGSGETKDLSGIIRDVPAESDAAKLLSSILGQKE